MASPGPTISPAANDPLFELDNVVLAPHGLAWTDDLARDNTLEACDNILALARGAIPEGVVNRDVLDNAAFQRKLASFRSRS